MKDYTEIRRFGTFTEEEKKVYFTKADVLYRFLVETGPCDLDWETLDKYIGHLYRFVFDKLKESVEEETNYVLTFDDSGLHLRKVREVA